MLRIVQWFLPACLVAVLSHSHAIGDDPLRYRPAKDQQFGYDVKIRAELPDKFDNFSGVITYKVLAADDPSTIEFRGGLKRTSAAKPNSTSSRRSGPGIDPFGMAPPPGPFTKNPFPGTSQTTNKVKLNSRGEILSLEGSSQLPYLVGNLSLLVFETLPVDPDANWTTERGTAITEASRDDRHRFAPGDPFDDLFGRRNDKPKKTTAAGEVTNYAIEDDEDDRVRVQKTYKLTAPARDGLRIEVNGTGHWTFDRRVGMPVSLSFDHRLELHTESLSLTIPVSINYSLLSSDRLAEILKKRRADEEYRKKEIAKWHADLKARKEAPLTDEEKRQVLAGLQSSNRNQILEQLRRLLHNRIPKEKDPDVVAALTPLLRHKDPSVRSTADMTVRKWAPHVHRLRELNENYRKGRRLSSSERPVSADTKLPVGLVLQHHSNPWGWVGAEVLEEMPDGQVKIKEYLWKKTKVVPREKLQLAHDGIEQPKVAADQLAALSNGSGADDESGSLRGKARTWTDNTGKFKIEAELLELSNGKVKLRRTDGKTIEVPVSRLCEADRKLLEDREATPKTP